MEDSRGNMIIFIKNEVVDVDLDLKKEWICTFPSLCAEDPKVHEIRSILNCHYAIAEGVAKKFKLREFEFSVVMKGLRLRSSHRSGK